MEQRQRLGLLTNKFIDKLFLDFTKGDEVELVKRMLSPLGKRYLMLRHYLIVR
jgi:hypothetical protein